MKSLEELENIRKQALNSLSARKPSAKTRIVVGMATCGIAAGARPVFSAFVEETRGLSDIMLSQTGCIGMCRLEPIVEVYKPGDEKVTYVLVTPELARQIVHEHVTDPDGKPLFMHTLEYHELQNG